MFFNIFSIPTFGKKVRKKISRKPVRKKAYVTYKEAARVRVIDRLEYFNQYYHFTYGRISIRDQKTRWGSCSQKGNLNFNYKIALLPDELADYLVVHELCHIGEFNHSQKFWDLVGKTIPEYVQRRAELKRWRK